MRQSDEEYMMQIKEKVLNHNQEIAHADEEKIINNVGSLKGVIDRYLQIDEILITRELLRCKKLTTNSDNDLKWAVEALPMPLQAVTFECSSEIFDAKLEMNVLKIKVEKLHLNKMCDDKTAKGANASFEQQAKKHVKRGFKSELQLI